MFFPNIGINKQKIALSNKHYHKNLKLKAPGVIQDFDQNHGKTRRRRFLAAIFLFRNLK
jgi:hypothetical protein